MPTDKEIKEELKPCPFCGEIPEIKKTLYPNGHRRYFSVHCGKCFMDFFKRSDYYNSIEKWNRRK